MVERLSEGSRGLLEQLREADAPADDALVGGLERLRGELGDGIDAPGSGHAPAKPTSTGTSAAGKSSFALKLALAAVVSGGTVVALMLAGGDAHVPADTQPAAPPKVEAPEVEAPEVEAPVEAQAEDAEREPEPVEAPLPGQPAADAAEPAPEPAPASRSRPEKAADTDSNLEEELRLVRSATAASGEGDHEAALKLLTEHARRFPRGVLAGERELTKAKTLCAAGDRSRARKVADRYVSRHPKSHLVARFDEVCRD